MKFEDVLLALIARAPTTGYALGRWLATEGIFIRANADQSQIYRALGRLVTAGSVDFVVKKRGGFPDAKLYSLTAAGGDYLVALAESEYFPPARWQEPDFIARYQLLASIRPLTIVALLETELRVRREQIAKYRHRTRDYGVIGGVIQFDDVITQRLGHELHQQGVESMDRWVEWLESRLLEWTEHSSHEK